MIDPPSAAITGAMVVPVWIGIVVGVAVAAVFRRLGAATVAALAVLSAVGAAAAVAALESQTGHNWESVRTVIPMALAHGLPIYHRAGEGALWCNIYPPLGWAMLMPAALGRTPSQAIAIGQGLAVVFMWTPLVLIGLRSGIRGLALAGALALCVCGGHGPLRYTTFAVHVDAPALGLGLLALIAASTPGNPRRLVLAGALAAASVFAKQTLVLLPVTLVCGVALRDGRAAAIRVTVSAAGTAIVLLGLCCVFFDPRALVYCIVTVPSRQGFGEHPLHTLGVALVESVYWIVPMLGLAVGLLWAERRAGVERTRTLNSVLMVAAGLVNIPLALAAYAKLGGDLNNFAFVTYFLFASALGSVTRLAELANVRGRVLAGVTALGISAAAYGLYIVDTYGMLRTPNQHDAAYALIQQRPGVYYFSWLPLSHYMAEGRLTHQSWGIMDRLLAGEQVGDGWLKAYMPPSAAFECVRTRPGPSDAAYEALKQAFPRSVELPELPGWFCYTRL